MNTNMGRGGSLLPKPLVSAHISENLRHVCNFSVLSNCKAFPCLSFVNPYPMSPPDLRRKRAHMAAYKALSITHAIFLILFFRTSAMHQKPVEAWFTPNPPYFLLHYSQALKTSREVLW